MNFGKVSNWVHWSYAVRTGTLTSTVSMIWDMRASWFVGKRNAHLRRWAFGLG